MVCAQCPQVAEEACRLRYVAVLHGLRYYTCQFSGIQLMRQVAASGDYHCTIMAECALERLFAANLPAKYWVTGSLDMTDSTVNIEFYDAGPVSHPVILMTCLHKQLLAGLQQLSLCASLSAPPTATQRPADHYS